MDQVVSSEQLKSRRDATESASSASAAAVPQNLSPSMVPHTSDKGAPTPHESISTSCESISTSCESISASCESISAMTLLPSQSEHQCKNNETLRILVLHGFRDNGARRLKQMENLTRKLPGVSFYALDAPFSVTLKEQLLHSSEGVDPSATPEAKEAEVENFRKWWSLSKAGIFTNPHFDTLDESLNHLRHYLEHSSDGPFDGILGFSQGAVMTASFLLMEHMCPQLPQRFSPHFAILVGGFAISDQKVKALTAGQHVSIPLLHIMGSKDTLVPIEQSLALIEQLHQRNKSVQNDVTFVGAQILQHSGGHYVPSSSSSRKAINAWLDAQRQSFSSKATRSTSASHQVQQVQQRAKQVIKPSLPTYNNHTQSILAATPAQNNSSPHDNGDGLEQLLSEQQEHLQIIQDQLQRVLEKSHPEIDPLQLVDMHDSIEARIHLLTDTMSAVAAAELALKPSALLMMASDEASPSVPSLADQVDDCSELRQVHLELAQPQLPLPQPILPPAITSDGKHDHIQHVDNMIALAKWRLNNCPFQNMERRHFLAMELRQWQRVRDAKFTG